MTYSSPSPIQVQSGTLYIVASPIGNLGDITLRALEVLSEVDEIACEDTRHSKKLLTAYEIQKPLFSFHDHSERSKTPRVLEKLQAGKSIALLSDAGTPLISDPGFHLLREVIAAGIPMEALPGPSALIQALVLSGLPPVPFTFVGFLPPKSAARRRALAQYQELSHTLIFFESRHRISKFLQEALEVLGDRPVVLARELTKKYGEVFRGSLSKAQDSGCLRSWKGEFVVLLGTDVKKDV